MAGRKKGCNVLKYLFIARVRNAERGREHSGLPWRFDHGSLPPRHSILSPLAAQIETSLRQALSNLVTIATTTVREVPAL
jgi:hypothetical protein